MAGVLRIALAQVNLTVGAIRDNVEKVIATAAQARDELSADLVAFPELTLTSYPPEDLLLRPGLAVQVEAGLREILARVHGIAIVIGYPRQHDGQRYNAAALLHDGRIVAEYHKQHLPNYSVFDEKRYFSAGSGPVVVTFNGLPISLSICEDIWVRGTAAQARAAGAKLILNINASPYQRGKLDERYRILHAATKEAGLPIVYVNLIGGQDELIFDGGSMAIGADGTVRLRAPEFEEGLYVTEITHDGTDADVCPGICSPALRDVETVYRALVLGVRDYAHKNGFGGAVLGLSGGIDSALTLAIAVDALGKECVEALLMPSRYTAAMSVEDAETEARALGVNYHLVPIEPAVTAFDSVLSDFFKGLPRDITEENIQARCRGVILMAFSNKKRKLLLTTGNKSEMAVGYATLYGDMAGGFAPLKDVPKTLVYELCAWRNTKAPVIPQRAIDRPPSAELAPDQKDEDSLPPYSVLDPVLERYIELDQTPGDIIKAGYPAETVRKVIKLVDRNEYKRRQAAPGVRITPRAFGRDRRYPITSRYEEPCD